MFKNDIKWGFSSFYVDLLFSELDCMISTTGIRNSNYLSFASTWIHSQCYGGSVMLFLSFVLFVFVMCLVYPMLHVFLDYTFLIAPTISSNVYY